MPPSTAQTDIDGRRTASDGNSADSAPESQASTEKPEQQKRGAQWKVLCYFTTRTNLPILILGILCSIIAGGIVPAHAYLVGKLFDRFISYATGTLNGGELIQQQRSCILYLLALSCGIWVFRSLEFILWMSFGELQAKSARDRLYHGLLEKEVEWYDLHENGIGALLPRLQAQIRDLQLATSQPLGILVSAVAQSLICLAEAFHYSWKLTLVALSTTPLLVVVMVVLGSWMQKNIASQQDKLAEAQKFSTSAFTAIDTVKYFNGQHIEREKYMLRIRKAAECYFRQAHASGLQMAAAVLLGVITITISFYYGGTLISSGQANSSAVVTTFFAAVGGFSAVQMILPQMINLEKGRTAGTMLKKIVAQIEKKSEKAQHKPGLLRPGRCRGDIEVKNLVFAYPARREVPVLNNVSLRIFSGEMVFLIGKSGSGKSTLSQLLMRFYTASQGSITVDGASLESLDIAWLRENITLAEQQSLLFNDTVFQNIAYGKGSKGYDMVTKREVWEAAEFALLRLPITNMQQGLETTVGHNGGSMSGGQRQRMALARARLRDSPILILDESTSALDHISRQLMMDAIRVWRKNKTTIVITHDISQILPGDYIYLLEHGKLVQEGYRRHLESMKDTPFQGFLPPESRAKKQNDDMCDFETIRSGTFSSDSDTFDKMWVDEGENYNVLGELLDTRKSRKSISHLLAPYGYRDPVLHTLGSGGCGRRNETNASLKIVGSHSSPGSFLADEKKGDMLWGLGPSQLVPECTDDSDKRQSEALAEMIDRTGKYAAETRLVWKENGAERKLRRTTSQERKAGLTTLTEGKEDDQFSRAGATNNPQLSLRQVFSTVWPNIKASARILLMIGIYGATIHAVATPLTSFLLSKLLQSYSQPHPQHTQLTYSMALFGVAVVDSFHTWLQRFLLGSVGQLWVDNIRDKAVKRILDQPKAFFEKEKNDVGHLSESLDRSAECMRELLGNFAGLGYMALLMCFVSIAWAIVAQWKMALIALSVAPFVFGVTRLFAVVSGKWEARGNDAARTASAIFTETFTNIKTVRALTLEERFKEKYEAATKHGLIIGFLRAFYTGLFFGLSDSAGIFAQCLIFYVASNLVSGGTSVENVIQVAVMLVFAIANLSPILECIPQASDSRDAATQLLQLTCLPEDSHEHFGDARIGTVGEIVFENLCFSYPSRPGQTILKGIDLTIKAGTCTAIVGSSGSGKSTIANLLLNIWSVSQRPKANRLMISGRHVNSISTPTLRSLIVPVPQHPTLFATTIAENIAYGLPRSSPFNTSDAIAAAAEAAGIHDFVISLPRGYNTPIGNGGMGLSGGQAQRIAIARALVRNPFVLVLDEATSALDVESAAVVQHTIKSLVSSRSRAMTVIIITHNKEMMAIAENIVVLDQGQIVETGGLRELLAKNGALTNLLSER